MPRSPIFLYRLLSNRPAASNSRARGRSSSSTNLRTVSRNSVCSGVENRSCAIGGGPPVAKVAGLVCSVLAHQREDVVAEALELGGPEAGDLRERGARVGQLA